MISVANISKNFGTLKAVDDVSFELKKGEVVGFLGPNGAGKTTAMRILTGFLPPSSGKVFVGGMDMARDEIEAKKMIGYLPEQCPLYGDMEVTDYLSYLGRLRCLSPLDVKKNLKEVIGTCGLNAVLGKKILTLSKGYRQRVGLASALLHHPPVLVLDEPTVGLDPNQIIEIRRLIREIGKNRTVLLSTHILTEVEQTCERVLIISEGKIVGQGTPQELMSQTHGHPVYHLGIRALREDIEKRLKALSGFRGLDFKKSGEDHRLALILEGAKDRSEEIYDLAVSQKWKLSLLKREEVGLETVFRKLTES